ncbi:MAG: alkaline phosphatase D family protein [Bryobacterales bacterium]|nr:alkaline phosphatase D family protein [Bryobacterales bacterium]
MRTLLMPTTIRRRRFTQGLALAAGAFAAPAFLRGPLGDAAEVDSRLFSLGVASGDPTASSVVLWTRIAPYPLQGGGLGPRTVPVQWEISSDPRMTDVVQSGQVLARPDTGHTVHVEVSGLLPDRWYWYRFRAGRETSRVGRTRTFPGTGEGATAMRFGLTSCQNYQQGFYSAWRDLAEQDLDFVVFVGDYIYEDGPTSNPIAAGRVHNGSAATLTTVAEYRNRYALYKLDENLKAAHARFPFIVTPDDHEVQDNYAGDWPRADLDDGMHLQRRANAYQVYYETMPLRNAQRASGSHIQVYRTIDFGDLARFVVMDTRQFRTDQPCGDGFGSTDPAAAALEPALGPLICGSDLTAETATMTGADQEAWVFQKLLESKATWNMLAQQVMMTRWDLSPIGAAAFQVPLQDLYSVDAWDGYPAARARVLRFLDTMRPANPVVLTGDIHSSWAANLLADFNDPGSYAVGAEFVCSSISSSFGEENDGLVRLSLSGNPHIRHFDGLKRGYTILEVTRDRCSGEFRAVENVADPASSVSSLATFRVRSGFNAAGAGPDAMQKV